MSVLEDHIIVIRRVWMTPVDSDVRVWQGTSSLLMGKPALVSYYVGSYNVPYLIIIIAYQWFRGLEQSFLSWFQIEN